jgi:hypothetical protein
VDNRRKIIAAFLILLLAILACNVPEPSKDGRLKTVAVNSFAGNGQFRAMLDYFLPEGDTDLVITCSYPGPDGSSTINSQIDLTSFSGLTTFDFQVNKPGTYTIHCQDNRAHSASDEFSVAVPDDSQPPLNPSGPDAGQPPANPSGPDAGQPPANPDKIFTRAQLTFNGDQAVFDTYPLGGPKGGWLEGYAYPNQYNQNNEFNYIIVSADGQLLWSINLPNGGITPQESSLTGHYIKESGLVDFHLTVKKTWTPVGDEANGNMGIVEFNGEGKLLEDAASGMAGFTVKCTAYGTGTCYHDTTFQELGYSGTIPFTIKFLP